MKIGISQLSQPAPIVYKRFVNAMIIIIIPAMVTFMLSIPASWMTTEVKIFITNCGVFACSLLKGLEYFLGGNDSPSPASTGESLNTLPPPK